MNTRTKIITKLADALRQDLDDKGLKRYLAEQERMIENEMRMGRRFEKYCYYRDAAKLALGRKL